MGIVLQTDPIAPRLRQRRYTWAKRQNGKSCHPSSVANLMTPPSTSTLGLHPRGFDSFNIRPCKWLLSRKCPQANPASRVHERSTRFDAGNGLYHKPRPKSLQLKTPGAPEACWEPTTLTRARHGQAHLCQKDQAKKRICMMKQLYTWVQHRCRLLKRVQCFMLTSMEFNAPILLDPSRCISVSRSLDP